MAFKLESRAFRNEESIPVRYTAQGQGISPPLEWSEVPPGTIEFALICEDPDAPFPQAFVHWIIYGLSANTSNIPEGIPTNAEIQMPVLARQGLNSSLRKGYLGPNPPFWHGAHRYFFKLFALDAALSLRPGAGRSEFFRSIEGHVLGRAQLIGTYEKAAPAKARSAIGLALRVAVPVVAISLFRKSRGPIMQPEPQKAA